MKETTLTCDSICVVQPDRKISAGDEFIPTRLSLLSRPKHWEDQESWRDFFDTYWKLLCRVAFTAFHLFGVSRTRRWIVGALRHSLPIAILRSFHLDPGFAGDGSQPPTPLRAFLSAHAWLDR